MRAHIFFILAQFSVGSSHFGFDDAISNEKGNIPFDNEKNDLMFYSNRFGLPPVGGTNIEAFDTMKDVKNIEEGLPSDERYKPVKHGDNETVSNDTETDNFINIPEKHYNMAGHLLKHGGIRIFNKNDENRVVDLKLVDGNLNMTKTLSNGTKLVSEVKNVDQDNIAIIINSILTSEIMNNDDNITNVQDKMNTSSTLQIRDEGNNNNASLKDYSIEDVTKPQDHDETLIFVTQKMTESTEGKFRTHPVTELGISKVMDRRRMEPDSSDLDKPSPNEPDGGEDFKSGSVEPADEMGPDVGPGLGGRKAANQVPGNFGQSFTVFGAADGMGGPADGLGGPAGRMEIAEAGIQFGAKQIGNYEGAQAPVDRRYEKMQDFYADDYAARKFEEKYEEEKDEPKKDIGRAPKPAHETTLSEMDKFLQDHPTKSLVFDNESFTDDNFGINEYGDRFGKMLSLRHNIHHHQQQPYINKPSQIPQEFSPSNIVQLNMLNLRREAENKLLGIKPSENYFNTPRKTSPTYQQFIPPNQQFRPPGMPYYNSQFLSNQNKKPQPYPLQNANSIPNFPNAMSNYPDAMSSFPSAVPNFPGVMTNFPNAMSNYPGAMSNFPTTNQNFPMAMPNFPGAMSNFPNAMPNVNDEMYNYPSALPFLVTQNSDVRRTNDLGLDQFSDDFRPLIDSIVSPIPYYTAATYTTQVSVTPKTDKLRYLADTVRTVTNDVTYRSTSTPVAATSLSQSEIYFQSAMEKFAQPMPFRSDNRARYPAIVNQNATYLTADSNNLPSEVTRESTVIATPSKQIAASTSAFTFSPKEYHWYNKESLRRNTWSLLPSTQKEATMSTSTTRYMPLDMRPQGEYGEFQYRSTLMPSYTAVKTTDRIITEFTPEISAVAQPINVFVSKMMELDGGYLTTFASINSEYLSMKNATVITELSHAFVKEWDDLLKDHKEITAQFGERCLAEVEEFKAMIIGEDVMRLMDQTLRTYVALTTRNVSLSVDLNMLLSYIDTLYTPSEGEKMAKVADYIREYPNKVHKGYTANYIMKKFLYEVVLHPFMRLNKSLNKKLLIDGITMYLNKHYGDRKSFIDELMKAMGRRSGDPHSFSDLENNGVRKESTRTNHPIVNLHRTGESRRRHRKSRMHDVARDRYRAQAKARQSTHEGRIYGHTTKPAKTKLFKTHRKRGINKSSSRNETESRKKRVKQNCRMAATQSFTTTTTPPPTPTTPNLKLIQDKLNSRTIPTHGEPSTTTTTQIPTYSVITTPSTKATLPRVYHRYIRKPTPFKHTHDRSQMHKYDTMLKAYIKKRKTAGESSLDISFSSSRETKAKRRRAKKHRNKDRKSRTQITNLVTEITRMEHRNLSVQDSFEFVSSDDDDGGEYKRLHLKHRSAKGDDDALTSTQQFNFRIRKFRHNKNGRRDYDNNYNEAVNYNEHRQMNIDQNRYKILKYNNFKPQIIPNSLEQRKKDADASLKKIEREFIDKIKEKFNSLKHVTAKTPSEILNQKNTKANWMSPNGLLFQNMKYLHTTASAIKFHAFYNIGGKKKVPNRPRARQQIYVTTPKPIYQPRFIHPKRQPFKMAYVPNKFQASAGNNKAIPSRRFIRRKKIKPEFDIPDDKGGKKDFFNDMIDDMDQVGEMINKQNMLNSESDDKVLWDKLNEIETRLNKHMPSRRKLLTKEPREQESQAAVRNVGFRMDLIPTTQRANPSQQDDEEVTDKKIIIIM